MVRKCASHSAWNSQVKGVLESVATLKAPPSASTVARTELVCMSHMHEGRCDRAYMSLKTPGWGTGAGHTSLLPSLLLMVLMMDMGSCVIT